MAKALAETGLTERFTEHNLRAKVGSDTTLERARELLGHANARITRRHYRQRPAFINPSK